MSNADTAAAKTHTVKMSRVRAALVTCPTRGDHVSYPVIRSAAWTVKVDGVVIGIAVQNGSPRFGSWAVYTDASATIRVSCLFGNRSDLRAALIAGTAGR